MANLDSILKSRDITLPTKVRLVKAMVFPVVMYGCESWTVKKAERQRTGFWTVVLEKTLESPLDCKEIQPVHPTGDQSWVFIGRTDVEAETPILWPPDAKSWLIGKDPDAGKVWGQEEKGTTEDEMVGWRHRLDGHGFGWTPGVGDGQGKVKYAILQLKEWPWVFVTDTRLCSFVSPKRGRLSEQVLEVIPSFSNTKKEVNKDKIPIPNQFPHQQISAVV